MPNGKMASARWTKHSFSMMVSYRLGSGNSHRRATASTRATAGDVVGDASMQVSGNSLFLDYVLRIPYGDGTLDLKIDDRMYLVSQRVLFE